MSLKNRLRRLKGKMPAQPGLTVVVVDDAGLVVDDGTEVIQPWVGKHYTELPPATTVYGGFDPRKVLGLVGEPAS